MVRSGKWSGAEPAHYVALHLALHEKVYGVECDELFSGRMVGFAKRAAGLMLERDFAGDRALFARYMQWIWQEERRTEEWRRSNGRGGGYLPWQVVFGRKGLGRFKIAMAREKATGRR